MEGNHMSDMQHDGGLFDGLHAYATSFTALNNSGVGGRALLFLNENTETLTVDIQAHGLEPGQMHAQHIHGFDDDSTAHTPTFAQDADHDGFVELAEGLVKYGPIQLNLTLNPEDSAHDHGTAGHDHTGDAIFPTADAKGNLHYVETFHFNRSDPNAQAIFDGITPLNAKEVVLHGLTLRRDKAATAARRMAPRATRLCCPSPRANCTRSPASATSSRRCSMRSMTVRATGSSEQAEERRPDQHDRRHVARIGRGAAPIESADAGAESWARPPRADPVHRKASQGWRRTRKAPPPMAGSSPRSRRLRPMPASPSGCAPMPRHCGRRASLRRQARGPRGRLGSRTD
jgi:hypothetical protein